MTDEELEEQVNDFAMHRAELKKPMTAIAIKQLRNRAIRMRAKGVNVQEAFDKAIACGWLSIYEPKEEAQHRPASHAPYVPDTAPTWNKEAGKAAVGMALRALKGGKA